MSLAPPRPKTLTLAWLPLGSWMFGLQIWLSMVVALYVAFWLQLASASSAAVCVGILALPTRGQAFQKAAFRLLATGIGIVASIVITGLFGQARDLFLLAAAGWLAACVFVAGLLDGNRAYGAVLSGYTVAIVSVAQIDAPQNVFATGMDRGAAEVIGILAIAFVSDVLMAPDLYPLLLGRLAAAEGKVRAFAAQALRDGADPVTAARLVGEITSLHSDITALSGESVGGAVRATAARAAAAAMVGVVQAARAAGTSLARWDGRDQSWRDDLAAAASRPHSGAAAAVRDRLTSVAARARDIRTGMMARHGLDLLERTRLAKERIDDMRSDRGPARAPRLPIFRSRRAAARNALRVFLAVMVASIFFVLSGWPLTSSALLQLAALAALSTTNPSPRGFAGAALIGLPLAAIAAGLTEFLLLDGADQFELLAIALAPPVFVGCFLLKSGNPKLTGVGFLLTVFFPVFLSPSNPQPYDPQSFLFSSTLTLASAVGLFITLSTILPISDERRRMWYLASARADARDALSGRRTRRAEAETMYRDADRIAQLAALQGLSDATKRDDLREAFALADLAAAARRVSSALDRLERDAGTRAAAAEGRRGLETRDPVRLRRAAALLVDARQPALGGSAATGAAAADLCWAGQLMEGDATDPSRIDRQGAP